MPHIVVEHSDSLTAFMRENDVLRALHSCVTDSGLFDPQAVKARAMPYVDAVLPEGADRFVHITVSILSGRTSDQRAALSQAVFEAAQRKLSTDIRLSVNIHEMDAQIYKK